MCDWKLKSWAFQRTFSQCKGYLTHQATVTWSWSSVWTYKRLENLRNSLCSLMFPYQKQLKSKCQVFWKLCSKTFTKLTTMLPDRLGTPAVQLGTYTTHIFGHYMFVKMATGFPAICIQPWPTLVLSRFIPEFQILRGKVFNEWRDQEKLSLYTVMFRETLTPKIRYVKWL